MMPLEQALVANYHSAGLFSTLRAVDLPSEELLFDGVVVSSCITAAGGGKGGDWCEVFALGDGTIGMSIGDVCGHGEAAFALMATLRQIVRDTAMRGYAPPHALVQANTHLIDRASGDFATAIFGVLDASAGTFTFASAGHPPPLLAGAFGAHYMEFGSADLPLGVSPKFDPDLHSVIIPMETLLVLYTDGITEHARDAVAGAAELMTAALATFHFAQAPVASEVAHFMGLGASQEDDAAILTAWVSAG